MKIEEFLALVDYKDVEINYYDKNGKYQTFQTLVKQSDGKYKPQTLDGYIIRDISCDYEDIWGITTYLTLEAQEV